MTAKTRIAVVCPFSFLQGASLISAATEPLPHSLPPFQCNTHWIRINSIIKRGTVSSKWESSQKDSNGNVFSLRDEGLFIPDKMKLHSPLSGIYGCATCSADMFTKWLKKCVFLFIQVLLHSTTPDPEVCFNRFVLVTAERNILTA